MKDAPFGLLLDAPAETRQRRLQHQWERLAEM